MVGAELHYVTGGFFIEGEYARRYLKTKVDNDDILNTTRTAALIHSYYRFEMPRRFVMSYIAPMVRWDLGNNMDYLNTANTVRETVDANRIAVGINFGFGKKLVNSEIRLNCEKYFLKGGPATSANKLLQDKFALEVVAAFLNTGDTLFSAATFQLTFERHGMRRAGRRQMQIWVSGMPSFDTPRLQLFFDVAFEKAVKAGWPLNAIARIAG